MHSRRKFIKRSISAGGFLLVPSYINTILANVLDSSKINLGVIGVGSRGTLLIKHLNALSNKSPFNIIAVCDNYKPNYNNALHLTQNKAKAFSDYRKLLELNDIDAIIVATPLHEHTQIVLDALESGIHVFCEKSMARTLNDTKKMADAHYKTGKILQIGHQRLFDPKYIKGIEMIRGNMIGPITQMRAYWHRNNDWRRKVPIDEPELERKINWRLYKEYSCGLMTELACHQIQVANWAKNDLPVSVKGSGSINYWKDGRDVCDNVALIYSYSDGTQLIYDSMISNRFYGLEEQIMGDSGTIEFESNRFYSENPPAPPKPPAIMQLIADLENNIFNDVKIGNSSWLPETKVTYQGEPIIENDSTDGTLEQLIAFAKAVQNNKPLPGVFEQGYYASIWSLLGYDAIHTNKSITIPEYLKL